MRASVVLSVGLMPVSAFLIGMDFGREYFKIVAVRPGKAFETVHNIHSKRKTPTAVSFFEAVRGFGDDALAHQGKGPNRVLQFFPSLLGSSFSDTVDSGLPQNFFPYDLQLDDERGVPHYLWDDRNMSIEEVAGHVFAFSKKISEVAAEATNLREAVITVPAFSTQRQRQAIIDSANIAGFDKVHLIHETAAAAIQRALDIEERKAPEEVPEVEEKAAESEENDDEKPDEDGDQDTKPKKGKKDKPKPKKHVIGSGGKTDVLFFNMGSRHVEACIVRYNFVEVLSKPAPVLETLGCGFSDRAGGHFADVVIAQKMEIAFKEKYPKLSAISDNKRALKKLLTTAQKTKHVLSANKQGRFGVEGLFEEQDFATNIDRSDFEGWMENMFAEILRPVDQALAMSNLTMDDLDGVEVIGGGWRIPKVQEVLSEYLLKQRAEGAAVLPLGQHLNGEEAAAMGAAFWGANNSVSFRVKKVFATDIVFRNYSLEITKLDGSQGEEDYFREINIVPLQSPLNKKKAVTLQDVHFDLLVKLLEDGKVITTYEVKGIHEAATEKFKDLDKPVVILRAGVDASGIVAVREVEAVFKEPPPPEEEQPETKEQSADSQDANAEEPAQATADEAKQDPKDETQQAQDTADKSQDSEEASAGSSEADSADGNSTQSEEVKAEGSANTTDTKTDKKKKKKKAKKHKVLGVITAVHARPLPMSEETKSAATASVRAADEHDAEVRATDAAKNALEAYIYEARDKLDGETVQIVSTEDQRDAIRSDLTIQEEWLYEDGYSAKKADFNDKLAGLRAQVDPILKRAREHEERPALREHIEKSLGTINATLAHVKLNMTWVAESELEKVHNMTEDFSSWLEGVEKQQSELSLTDEPAYTIADVKRRLSAVSKEAKRLKKIKKIEKRDYDSAYWNSQYGSQYGPYGANSSGFDFSKFQEFMKKQNMSSNFTGNGSGYNESDYLRAYYESMMKGKQWGKGGSNSTGQDNTTTDQQSEEGKTPEDTEGDTGGSESGESGGSGEPSDDGQTSEGPGSGSPGDGKDGEL
mmetsp:Transcript_50581/g.114848  ORF Transcript_50581/g.114848 Transcript_50581/m.114848 type:complete len:1042 (+) Transcript_50581:95-3220(+)